MSFTDVPNDVARFVDLYNAPLRPPAEELRLTVERRVFEHWLGRRVGSALKDAYGYLRHRSRPAVLITLPHIDLDQPMALEIVDAEELMLMRDWIDGDWRRHSYHRSSSGRTEP